MDPVILILGTVTVILIGLLAAGMVKDVLSRERARTSGRDSSALPRCPVCRTPLAPGERVSSRVFSRGKQANQLGIVESMAHILGCPHCYPAPREVRRRCPVCGKDLLVTDVLVARMFENTRTGRKHVRILGCSRCRD